MKRLLFSLMIAFPSSLWSETIDVRAGEHVDFSRIVMQFSAQEDWQVSRVEDGYIFSTSADVTAYDTQSVFDLIPRTRVAKIEPFSDRSLKIYTNSGFHADAFELRAGRVVIDIKDGPAPNNSVFEQEWAPEETSDILEESPIEISEQIVDSALFAQAGTNFASQGNDLVAANTSANSQLSSDQQDESEPSSLNFFSEELDPIQNSNERVSELEAELIAQLGRAASQGLLDVALPEKENAEAITSTQNRPTPAVEQILPEEEPEEGIPHIRIQTSADRDSYQDPTRSQVRQDGLQCLSNSFLDINEWGLPLEDSLIFSNLRQAAIGEFDQPDTTGVENLAKYYLFLTFGAEAQNVMAEFGVYVRQANVLNALAEIMDDGYSTSPSHLDAQLECGGIVGFWSAVSQKEFEKGVEYPVSEIGSYFSGLPLHLRRHLGPSISERFLKAGNITAAKMIQSSIDRAEGEHGDAYKLLIAEMSLSEGAILPAIMQLEELAGEDGALAPEALIRAIELRAIQGLEVDPKTAEFAEILAIEHKGTKLEHPLVMASIKALIHSGSADVALNMLLEGNVDTLSQKETAGLLNEALTALIASPSDIKFAKSATSLAEETRLPSVEPEVKVATAERLLQLGFVEIAARFVNANSELTPQVQMMLAKIETSRGNNAEALGYLLSLQSQEASALRAENLLQLERPNRAAAEFEALGETASKTNAEYLAEDWSSLENSDNTALSALASLMLAEENVEDGAGEPESLEDLGQLLDRSQSTRSILQGLLE